MSKLMLSSVIAVAALASSAPGALVVSPGDWTLLPNQPNQQISVAISGSGSVTNASIILQITGSGTRPTFSAANIITGTIFASNNTGSPQYDLSAPQLAYADVATLSGTVDGNGTIATFTVDTTGVLSGDFPVKLTGTAWGNSVVGTFPATGVSFSDGSITVAVPEPASLSLIALLGYGLARRVRRA